MAQLQQGYLFDSRYRLLKKLGEGGYSEVWLVEDTSVGLEQVLKIFLPSAQLDDTAEDLFCKEFKLVYNINHPNLLKYSYFGVCVDYPYLLMPYYDKGSAESMIGKCSETTAWHYIRDVAAGLACLHSQKPAIIHQDIKPENVLLDDGGNFIITDFGISANMHSLFAGGDRHIIKGTPPYIPPEKYLENPQIVAENDIWSLGVSIYELLTGELLFGNRGGENQLKGATLPPRPTHISYDMWKVISSCLSRYPEQRPTAREIADYAEEMLNPTPYIAPIISNPYTTSGNHSSTAPSSYSGQSPSHSGYSKNASNMDKERNSLHWIIAAASAIFITVMIVVITILFSGRPAEPSSDVVKQEQTDTTSNTNPTRKKSNPKVSQKNNSNKNLVNGTKAEGNNNENSSTHTQDNVSPYIRVRDDDNGKKKDYMLEDDRNHDYSNFY